MAANTTSRPSQVLLLSQGRTGCHLLERIFSKQPKMKYLWHPVATARPAQIALYQEESVAAGIPDELKEKFAGQVASGIETWQTALKEAQAADEALFVHEHPHFGLDPTAGLQYLRQDPSTASALPAGSNCTLIPASILLHPRTLPILTFRHPALLIPAAYKALSSVEAAANPSNIRIISHNGWWVQLHKWYTVHGITPLVAEAEDYIGSADFTRHLAARAGMDPRACIFEWPRATQEERNSMHPMYVALQGTLLDSEGLVPSKARKGDVDLEVERRKWEAEFGTETADMLERAVKEQMPCYEWLRERKVRMEA